MLHFGEYEDALADQKLEIEVKEVICGELRPPLREHVVDLKYLSS